MRRRTILSRLLWFPPLPPRWLFGTVHSCPDTINRSSLIRRSNPRGYKVLQLEPTVSGSDRAPIRTDVSVRGSGFGAYPGDVCTPSARVYLAPGERDYPFHDLAIRITRCGRFCIDRRKINLPIAFADQTVGVRLVEEQIWQVSFRITISDTSITKGGRWNRPKSVRTRQCLSCGSGIHLYKTVGDRVSQKNTSFFNRAFSCAFAYC